MGAELHGRSSQVAAGENPLGRKRRTLAKVASTPEWGLKNEASAHAYSRVLQAVGVTAAQVTPNHLAEVRIFHGLPVAQ